MCDIAVCTACMIAGSLALTNLILHVANLRVLSLSVRCVHDGCCISSVHFGGVSTGGILVCWDVQPTAHDIALAHEDAGKDGAAMILSWLI